MAPVTTPVPPAAPAPAVAERPPLWAAVARHRLAAIILAVVLVVLVGMILAAALLSSRGVALADSATCSAWTSADSAQRTAYGQSYVNEHGAPAGATLDADRVVAALNTACTHAAYLGEADDVSLLAAIQHAF